MFSLREQQFEIKKRNGCGKCPKISNILFHTILTKFCFVMQQFLKIVDW